MGVVWHKKRKRLKPVCHILTISQIRQLGKILKLPSLTKSMETFMEPANILLYNKPKLTTIHQYLLDHDLTNIKQPSARIKQQDHARLLLDLIYPGYSFGKAKEQACRQDRENRPISNKKGTIYFAYDQLPTKESFERWEELIRLDTQPSLSTTIESSSNYRYTIDMQKLERHLSTSKDRNLRFHLYLWMSPRYPVFPHCISLKFNDIECWTEKDKEIVTNNFKYIDITDKLDWNSLKDQESKDITLCFTLDDTLVSSTIKHITICSVWEKSNIDLTCQLYTQSASNCISTALSTSKNILQAQRDATYLLDQYRPSARWLLDNVEALFLESGRLFFEDTQHIDDNNSDDDDDDLVMGNEYISLMDPIMLTKIQHPTRSIFCRHTSCFDAISFFKCHKEQQQWTCPLCYIHIRGIRELYIDYPLKRALTTYPEHTRFILTQDGTYQTEDQYQPPKNHPPLSSYRPSSPLTLKEQPLSPTALSPLILSEEPDNDDYHDDDDDGFSKTDEPLEKRPRLDNHSDIIILE
ncbi:uncharacterized protein BX664DRAFT_336187 [Halteromyces radiatus]|uniref:uncharacterized protein n=1 Tax=Halteromyces radiatus TaxID=101107 RepID=UPI00221E702B|nr:uncharacterized protein BX664DRAFT_336187 [Halteromyces radiatus]KAI8086577.1 hypothetical protein BX664DRAFT_336187 [Halteromyces radiatus]